MENKTPEQIAFELFPVSEDVYGEDENRFERAVWLSRQAEVDELKRQVEELKKGSYAYWYRKWKDTDTQLVAKEKEIDILTKKLEICESQLEDYRNMK